MVSADPPPSPSAVPGRPMSIADAARALGLSITSVRRLEVESGMHPPRTATGKRLYSPELIHQLRKYLAAHPERPGDSAKKPANARLAGYQQISNL